MNINIKKLFENNGFNQFILKSSIFFGILLFLNLFISLYFRHTEFFLKYLSLGAEFYIPSLTGLTLGRILQSITFVIVIFFIYNWDRFRELELHRPNIRNTVVCAFLAAGFLILQYVFKYLVKANMGFALQHASLMIFAKYLINILFIFFLALAAYDLAFLRNFFRKFYRSVIFFAALAVAYYFIIELFQRAWYVLSKFVAKTLYFVFSLMYEDVFINIANPKGPVLGAHGFTAGISKECSGIDSLLLFISLYIFLFALNYKTINKKRMLALFIPGLAMAVIFNLLRIFLLYLVGIYISPEFAVDVFHANVGWILFLMLFFVFWHYGSEWVYKR